LYARLVSRCVLTMSGLQASY